MNPTQSLMSAIRFFDVDTVENLLQSDFEIDYRNEDHHSVLHTAVALIDSKTITDCFKEESDKHLNPLYKPEALRRIVEVLLESGRFNVNALTKSCMTVLHVAVDHCRGNYFSREDYKDLVNAIIELLLKNNANINAKTSEGETPLMKAAELGCSHVVHLLLDWRDAFGSGVDLNARDIRGETALIKAAKYAHVDVIELLLQHGCLDEIQDHRGFSALHAVIYGCELMNDASSDFLGSIGVDASEKTLELLDQYGANDVLGETIRVNCNKNNDIQKIVRMLITFGRADVNSLDFKGNTVLDIAFKAKLRISQETVEKLKEYGATSGALPKPEYPENTFKNVDKLGKTPLHRLSAVLPESSVLNRKEVLESVKLLNSSPFKEFFDTMAVAKDHRGRTALHYAVTSKMSFPDDAVVLENLLKLTHTGIINETDNYGRTPLHYCQDENVYESLVEQGAVEHIRDLDGKTPQDLKQLRKNEGNRHDWPSEAYRVWEAILLDDDKHKTWIDDAKKNYGKHLNHQKFDAWMIWKDSEYAYRDQFSKKLCNEVQHFLNRLSDGIKKKDPRFECRPVLIGSAEEGTKTGLPDEFDFNFILTKLGELCEVVPTPEAPSGFVHLKRTCNAEYQPKSQDFQNQVDFDGLFNSNGFLLTTEIASRFRILYLQIMSEPEFWGGETIFEWDPCNEIGMIYLKQAERYNDSLIPNDFKPSTHLCSNIRLILNRPIEGRYMFTPISLDIVPCIKVNGWWPEEALSGVNDEIKVGGCHLVFDQPQRKYPWVPFSEPFARISFATAESRVIKECSAVARAAYMVGKQLLVYGRKQKLTYVLKTSLLYSIEALKDCTSNRLLYEDIKPAELRFFVETMMLSFNEFYQQDFLPCYVMPSFHLPIEDYLKSNHDRLLYDSCFRYPMFSYEWQKMVCSTESPVDLCPYTREPLNEKFNREELLRKLSMDTSSIVIYRREQQESLLAGEMVRSDDQSESPVRLSIKRKQSVQMNANTIKVERRDCTETK